MLVVILFLLFAYVNPFNILVYAPLFAVSHNKFMARLADTLTEAGNNVTILAPVGEENIRAHIGVESTKNVWFVEQDEIMKENMNTSSDSTVMNWLWLLQNRPEDYENCYDSFSVMVKETCANLLRNQQVFDVLKNSHFDVAILEPISFCGFGLFEAVGIKKVILSTSVTQFEGVIRNTGEPVDLSFVPSHGSQTSDMMNFWQRKDNFAMSEIIASHQEKNYEAEYMMLQKRFGENFIHWRDLMPTASLFFTNSIPYLDFPRPIIQKTIAIGGISVDMKKMKAEKLDEKWENVLSLRKKNVLISFGSMVHSTSMPTEWRDTILANVKHFPDVTFIWKYENDDVKWADSVNNIYFSKWVPQTALLVDDRLSAFLTHGGLGSTNELAHCGKPAIMVPIFGDQMRNSNMLARLNGSIVLNKFDLEKFDIVNNALRSILYDESYLKNARKLAELLNDAPFNPKELVVRHTEFLAKYGPFPSMSPRINHLNYFEQKMLDVELYQFVINHYCSIGFTFIVLMLLSRFFRN